MGIILRIEDRDRREGDSTRATARGMMLTGTATYEDNDEDDDYGGEDDDDGDVDDDGDDDDDDNHGDDDVENDDADGERTW